MIPFVENTKNIPFSDKNNFNIENTFYKDKVYIKKSLTIPLTKEESQNIKLNIKLEEIKKTQNKSQIGTANIILNNKTIYTQPIYYKKTSSKKPNFWQKIRSKLND